MFEAQSPFRWDTLHLHSLAADPANFICIHPWLHVLDSFTSAMTLDDTIARLSQVSLAFKDFTMREKPPMSRLAHLVLNLPVREFLREADETEHGLYTIIRAPNPGAKDSIGGAAGPSTHGVQPKTVEIATPLKPQVSRRAGRGPGKVHKKGKGRALDDTRDPEVPLRAALKLVDI
jgi:hypothetical protein